MNVKDMKAMIDKLPDSTPILVPGPDHSYSSTRAMVRSVLLEGPCLWAEDWGDDLTPETLRRARVKAVVIT